MKTHQHLHTGSNGIHVYRREYKGNGEYYQRGICKDIKEEDVFEYASGRESLVVVKVLTRKDSKGVFDNPEDAINSLYEATMIDKSFNPNIPSYTPMHNI